MNCTQLKTQVINDTKQISFMKLKREKKKNLEYLTSSALMALNLDLGFPFPNEYKRDGLKFIRSQFMK